MDSCSQSGRPKMMAVAATPVMYAYFSGMAVHGFNAAPILTAKRPWMNLAGGQWPCLQTEISSLRGLDQMMAQASMWVMRAYSNGMAAIGFNAAVILTARAKAITLAWRWRCHPTDPSWRLAQTKTTGQAPMPVIRGCFHGMAAHGFSRVLI